MPQKRSSIPVSLRHAYHARHLTPSELIEIDRSFLPSSHLRVCRLPASSVKPAAVPLEPCGPITDCTITPSLAEQLTQSALHPPLASTHTHTHTHTLSLSLSLSLSHSPAAAGITARAYCPSSSFVHILISGMSLGCFILFFSELARGLISAI